MTRSIMLHMNFEKDNTDTNDPEKKEAEEIQQLIESIRKHHNPYGGFSHTVSTLIMQINGIKYGFGNKDKIPQLKRQLAAITNEFPDLNERYLQEKKKLNSLF